MSDEHKLLNTFNPKSFFWVLMAMIIILYARITMFPDSHPIWKASQAAVHQIINR